MRVHPARMFLEKAWHFLLQIVRSGAVRNTQPADVLVELACEHRLSMAPVRYTVLQVLAEALVVAEKANALALLA